MHPLVTTSFEHLRLNMLIGAVVSFVGGAILARYLALQVQILNPILYLILLLFTLTFLLRNRPTGLALLFFSFFLTGTVHTGYSLLPPSDPQHLYSMIQGKSKVTLTGRLKNMPEYTGQKTKFNFVADSILFRAKLKKQPGQIPVRGVIRLSIDSALPKNITPGDHLMVLATANRTFNYQTPGVFDYRMHMAEQSIFVTGKIKSTTQILPFTDSNDSSLSAIRSVPERVRHRIGIFLDNSLTPEAAGMYKALLIGSRAGVSDKVQEQFKATGCMHLLAISGLHMGLLGLMLTVSLTWLLKRSTYLLLHTHVPTLATLMSLLPLACYAFIAGMNTPVFRALIMSVLFLVGVILRRQRSIIHITAAAALVVLLCNPLALFTVSFQLSFSAILAIAIIYPHLLHLLVKTNKKQGHTICRYIVTAFMVSIAATLGSLPFMLFHFNRISLIGPFMNLLVEPFLCLWALPIGLIAVPFIFIAPGLANVLFEIGATGIFAADKITSLGSWLPFASIWTITPTPAQIIIYFILLAILLINTCSRTTKIAALVFALLLIGSFISGPWFPFAVTKTKTEVSFLDIGQGSSSFIRLPDGKTILIDGGTKTSSSYDVGERVIGPYLWKKQIRRLNDVIITHPDSDHYNGLFFILRHFRPKRVWINGDGKDSWAYRQLILLAVEKGIDVIEPKPGQNIFSGGEVQLTFLTGAQNLSQQPSPEQEQKNLSVNDRSLVLKLQHKNISFLFPGDLGFKGEELLVGSGGNVQADVLLAAHHGSSGSNSQSFITAVNPEIIVVSLGRNVRGPYFDKEHLQNWQDGGIRVLATAIDGTVTCITDGQLIDVNTFDGDHIQIKPSGKQPLLPN